MKRLAVAIVEDRITAGDLEALRRRVARSGGTSREAVVLDFLEDDLREVQGALARINDYVARVDGALRDMRRGRRDLLGLAAAGGPMEQVEHLESTLASMRRRLAQVAVKLPR